MNKIYDNCCGIDVHKKLLVCCFIQGEKRTIREYGATTEEILALCAWLTEGNCEIVAMESTASFWKPVYNILEASDLKAIIVNASHIKAVPGRKTDVKDAEWIAELLQHGLLQPSYIPDKDQRELRELVQYRRSLVGEQTRELNRLQKMLEGANIKLSGTIKDIRGKSARALINEIIEGNKVSLERLQELRKQKLIANNLKATDEQLVRDLEGVLSPLQKRMLKELLQHLEELSEHIKNLSDEIDNFMKPEEKQAAKAIEDVTGIGKISAQQIVAVLGADVSRFPSAKHLSAWAGLCPGNNESAKKRRNARSRKGNSLLRTSLIVCAHSAVKVKNSYFYAQFKRISSHRGSKKAYVAVAHSMLIAIYMILKNGVVFKDLGANFFNQFNKERKIHSYLKKLEALGWTPETAAVAGA